MWSSKQRKLSQSNFCLARNFPGGSVVKNLPDNQMSVQSLGCEDPLEKELAIHSSILACKVPWTEEPARLLSMGPQ